MDKAQTIAWNHLTPLEKSTLSLVVVSGKTRQEASIVLGLYPYKFTEVYNRGRWFFILFTDYYSTYPTLIPKNFRTSLPQPHLELVMRVLKERVRPQAIASLSPDFMDLLIPHSMSAMWVTLIRDLQLDPSKHARHFLDLIIRYDQWNNFRILPKEYRQPSPFPRRRNREFKKIHDSINTISDMGWEMVEDNWGSKAAPFAFIPSLLHDLKPTRVRLSRNSLQYFTTNRIPVFMTEEEALTFGERSYDFYNLSRVSTFSAQKFWTTFRLQISKAINYNGLLNITPGTMRDLNHNDKQFINRTKATENKTTAVKTRTPDKEFY